MYMKPKKASNKLDSRQKSYLKKAFGIKSIKELNEKILKQLKEAMKDLTDTRQQGKIGYKIWDIVVCVIVSVLCGKQSWVEIEDFVNEKYYFFRKFLKMTGGVPSYKTYERVMSVIDYKELEKILLLFFDNITKDILDGVNILAFDGRVSNGSKRNKTIKNDKITPLNMLNVYSTRDHLCIASRMIDSKTNEIPTMEKLLGELYIKNCIITNDALNTQKDTVAAVVAGLADYVMPIKANHPIFYSELQEYFDNKMQEYIIAGKPNTAYRKSYEYKNGTTITYEYFQTTDIKWYQNKDEWKKLHSIGMRKKTIEKADDTTTEYQYYISSLFINIDLFEKVIRNEWQVENKLHWHLDVTFGQDNNKTINKNALANLEIVNKFCLGILSRVKKDYGGISLKRIIGKLAANVESNFPELILFLVLSDGYETAN